MKRKDGALMKGSQLFLDSFFFLNKRDKYVWVLVLKWDL